MQRDAKLQGENSPIRCAPIRCFFISRNPKNSRIYVSTILGITLEQPVATWKPNRNNELRGVLLSVLKPLGQFQVRSRGSFFGWKKLAKIDCKIPLGQKKNKQILPTVHSTTWVQLNLWNFRCQTWKSTCSAWSHEISGGFIPPC